MTEWLLHHYLDVFLVFYILDKVAKITPTKYDDFVVDVLFGSVKKTFNLARRKNEKAAG